MMELIVLINGAIVIMVMMGINQIVKQIHYVYGIVIHVGHVLMNVMTVLQAAIVM